MSETLFAMLLKSRTPEAFVHNYLLPAIRSRKLDGSTFWDNVKKSEIGLKGRLPGMLKGETVNQIGFVRAGDPRNKIYLSLNDVRNIGFRGNPTLLTLNRGLSAVIENGDFDRGVSLSRVTPVSVLKYGYKYGKPLDIPLNAVKHWRSKEVAVDRSGKGKTVLFELDGRTFHTLMRQQAIYEMFEGYIASISFLGKGTDPGKIDAKLGVRKKYQEDKQSFTPYQRFHLVNRKFNPLLRSLGYLVRSYSSPSIEQIKERAEHFLGEKSGIVDYYSGRLHGLFGSNNAKSCAIKIAKDTEIEPEHILVQGR